LREKRAGIDARACEPRGRVEVLAREKRVSGRRSLAWPGISVSFFPSIAERRYTRRGMPTDDFLILPTTKIAALLDHYPELEDVLIGLAPPFGKLKNPFLRRGVARVASVQQAAAVAGMPMADLVNTLRAFVGQPQIPFDDAEKRSAYFLAEPDWFDVTRVVRSVDESVSDPDKMPIAEVLRQATLLKPGEILELVTHYLPAPGIDIMKSKGYCVWSSQSTPEVIRTFICKP
jgi:hypothetical protein